MRQVDRQKTVLIVEGDSDSRCFQKFTRASACRIFSPGACGGREQALALFTDLKEKRLPGVAALVDADCDRFWGRARVHSDVCWTSAADREVMIIMSPALDIFLGHHNFVGDRSELRLQLMGAALPLGCLRIMNRRANWGLDFKGTSFVRFIDPATLGCDQRSCCDDLLANNPNAQVDELALMLAIEEIRRRNIPAHDVVCGHDLSAIIALASKTRLGTSLSTVQVEWQLSDFFELAHFTQTSTFDELALWEQRNAPYIVNL
jgi:hypothetical protein